MEVENLAPANHSAYFVVVIGAAMLLDVMEQPQLSDRGQGQFVPTYCDSSV